MRPELSDCDLDVLMENVRRELSGADATAASAGGDTEVASKAGAAHGFEVPSMAASLSRFGATGGWYFAFADRLNLRFGQIPIVGAWLRYFHHAIRLPLAIAATRNAQEQLPQRVVALSDAINHPRFALVQQLTAEVRNEVSSLRAVFEARINHVDQVLVEHSAPILQLTAEVRNEVSSLRAVFEARINHVDQVLVEHSAPILQLIDEVRNQVGALAAVLETRLNHDDRGPLEVIAPQLEAIGGQTSEVC